ncbi:trigger factor [Salinarimonas ramus]|uniref:Trigger factor n=1 Tax=Salinarimonas ramus TaxID=690164 RepID=A0A917QAU4_9HYPH|nr:trigger factor [Salinarimonas ramus]GGK40366.1 trigger factor [Salinarimonas ramus]
MQVTETLSDGLKREFQVVLPASELEKRLGDELATLKDRVRINGFRPGKVPVAHLRRLYGRSVMAEVVQNAVAEAERKIVDENALKLANQPRYDFPEDKDEMEKALDAKSDLAFKVALEVLPSFEIVDVSDVAVTKPVAKVSDEEVTEALERMAAQQKPFAAKAEGEAAAAGDRVVVDFVGSIDGEEFEGGKGEGVTVELGSNTFIPGFEDQLVGAKAGEERTIVVTFPEAYPAQHLAGKEASFATKVNEVQTPGEVTYDDEFAKTFGMDSLDALKDALREALQKDYDGRSRAKVKKDLLDRLDEKYSFELPPTLVEQEFQSVWQQVVADMQRSGRTFEDEKTTEDEAKAEYRKIAERRVRLGLVLAQIGETAEIKVSDDEVTQGLIARARQYPGQERQVWEFYQKNPQALAEIRAPLFEEKVVDHILGQVKVNEETVSKEALFADEDETEGEGGESAAKAEA